LGLGLDRWCCRDLWWSGRILVPTSVHLGLEPLQLLLQVLDLGSPRVRVRDMLDGEMVPVEVRGCPQRGGRQPEPNDVGDDAR